MWPGFEPRQVLPQADTVRLDGSGAYRDTLLVGSCGGHVAVVTQPRKWALALGSWTHVCVLLGWVNARAEAE